MPLVVSFLVVLGLGFFFGLAFEEFYAKDAVGRPGGVRTFPLLALAGAVLYQLDPHMLIGLAVGLIVLGAWTAVYYRWRLDKPDEETGSHAGVMAPVCCILAYLLGPVGLAEPIWLAVGVTVAAVFLLTAKSRLHDFARTIDRVEIITAGQFLLLTGLVLPVLPDHPISRLVQVSPRQAWLALLAVCTMSYISYLLQRYVAKGKSGLWIALLGGLYSSTTTTVVIARRLKADGGEPREDQAGIMLATAVMYLRILVVVGVFNLTLALRLAPVLVILSIAGVAAALAWNRGLKSAPVAAEAAHPANPLQIRAALVFAVLFVIVSAASALAKSAVGANGVYALAAVVGFTDIDPFVLSLAQGNASPIPLGGTAAAILIAASSNNALKAVYAFAFGGLKAALAPGAALGLLALAGLAGAWWAASPYALSF